MIKNIKEIIIIILILLLSIISIGYYREIRKPIQETRIVDTIQVDRERIIEKSVVRFVQTIDTFVIPETDTIHDTIFFSLPIEHKEYTDTFRTDTSEVALNIKYSGFKPSLDEIGITNHYWQKEPLKTKKLKFKPSFNIGIGGGYGLGIREGSIKPEPQIGVYGTVGFSVIKD